MGLDEQVPVEFPSAVLSTIVDAVRHACGIVAQVHNPDELWDGYTLGTSRWRLTWNWIRHRLDELGSIVTIYDDERSLRIRVDDRFIVSIYPGGHTLDWDPYQYEFTRSRKRAEVATNNGTHQLVIDYGIDPDLLGRRPEMDHPDHANELTVVFASDPAGAVVVYLGAPVVTDTGTITWGWIRRIYTDPTTIQAATTPATAGYVPYSERPEPDLGLELHPNDTSLSAGDAS